MGQHLIQVTIQTTPGMGYFQAMVSKIGDNKYGVQGPVFRTNLYGNSSWCVESYVLKPICFCL
jgi:hypothetical protein